MTDTDSKQMEQRLIRIIIGPRKIDPATVTIDSTFEQLEISSYDALGIVFNIEDEFGIKIPDDEIYGLRTVRDVVTGVQNLLNQRNKAGAP
ncbi:MAG: acyl carrier protein [Sulfuricaulis sp.]